MIYTTGKRERILELMSKNADKVYTMEEICAVLTDGGRGKSTVYRLVSELVDEGCLKRISDGRTRHVTYQFVGGESCHDHLHLKCKECGKLVHLDEETSHALERTVLIAGGFAIETGNLLFGKCKECQEAKI